MTDFLLFEKALCEYNKISSSENKCGEKNSSEKNSRKSSFDDEEYCNNIRNKNDYSDDEYAENEDTEEIEKEYESDKEPDNKSCQHKNISNENSNVLCLDCGKELEKNIFQDKEWRYYGQSDNKRTSDPNRVHIRKLDDRSIYKDVENMGFSDKIISLANQLYIQVTKGQIFRGNSRKAIVFACIFHSFKLQGKPQTHENLIKIFELNRKTSLKGLKYVNLNLPKDSPIHTTYITPINLIEDIMDKFKASNEQKKEVIDLYNKIKNKSSKINRARPQSIASGLTYFWISLKDIDISLKDFAKKVELSELTISKIAKEISDILGIIPESWI
jgi:transcription initiation factor TFIIIB Brf1 subunit/transcription initiation factor TFIIB